MKVYIPATIASTMITTSVIPIIKVADENHSGLIIPSIQRDYKWGPGHIGDDDLNSAAYVFLADMIDFFKLRPENDIYFTGTLIVFEEPGEERTQLMDGQQRWTTITALMGVIRHILKKNNQNYSNIISEIEEKFLLLRDGTCFLKSRKRSDERSIEFIANIENDESVRDSPKSLKNTFVFKRDEGTYTGTSINCVIEYFYDHLCKEFGIRGSNSDVSELIRFYETISKNVYLNYSHTKSPILAYKMFVTANSRGTPLNNYDVFRGLVMANNRIKEYGDEKELQWNLDEADSYLQDLFPKKKNFGKAVDKAMSDAMTILQGKKISPTHVMSRLEHTITNFETRKELDELVTFFVDYFMHLGMIENQSGRTGKIQNLRMRYYGFEQQIQYYAAARIFWERDAPCIDDLMNVLEIIIIRKLVLMDGRISALFYQISPKHFELIRLAGKSSDKQAACVDAIRKEFEQSNENPSDNEIITTLETRTFNLEKTASKNKLITALLCLETNVKYSKFLFRNSQGNPKITYFMPKYDGDDIGFNYPELWHKRNDCPLYLGNCFLLKEDMTQKMVKEINPNKNKRQLSLHNKGHQFITYQNLLSGEWGEAEINSRTKELTALLVQRFPHNCKKETPII